MVNDNGTPADTSDDFTENIDQLHLPDASIDTTSDGLLFVVGATNEDNYSLSRAVDGGANDSDGLETYFEIVGRDNGDNAGGNENEQDPVSFVYLPLTTQDGSGNPLAMGKIDGNGSTIISSGTFTITPDAIGGKYTLTIPGETPSSGTLMISPEGRETLNVDNIVTYQDNGAGGWTIESRDLGQWPPQLQSVGTEPAFSFAFVPFDAVPTGPGGGAFVGGLATSVPEPSSVALTALAGLLLSIGYARRRA